jgi:phosphoglycerol geranylgeranyltransferase
MMDLALLEKLKISKNQQIKQLAVLIDPDKAKPKDLEYLVSLAEEAEVDYFFVGGSFLEEDATDITVQHIKSISTIPVIMFPGSPAQISQYADALLLLSLISGRNPDLLIGRHVEAALKLMQAKIEIMPTGYILIDGGRATTVSYISNTMPIPADKGEIAAFTALAGVQLGLQIIYMDAVSGALYSIPSKMIRQVSRLIDVPLIVGGGIRSVEQMKEAYNAGADVVVVGNAFEKNPDLLIEMAACKRAFALK